jgi:hypothetical protein
MPALADHRSETRDLLAQRLAAEFGNFTPDTVERCVADVRACMTHLGLDANPDSVERMAREHLVGMVKSIPPTPDPRSLYEPAARSEA